MHVYERLEGLIPVKNNCNKIYIVTPSLALGGAEKIIVDHIYDSVRYGEEVIILCTISEAYRIEQIRGITIIKVHPKEFLTSLAEFAAEAAKAGRPMLCHLLRDKHYEVIFAAGGRSIPVIHNDQLGWLSSPDILNSKNIDLIVACSNAVKQQLIDNGVLNPVVTIWHWPVIKYRHNASGNRNSIRNMIGVDSNTLLIGMVGALKKQKNYCFAIELIEEIQKIRPVVLCVVGGRIHGNKDDSRNISLCLEKGKRREYVRLVGWQESVNHWYEAFDAFLNTSLFEGRSISVCEAIQTGKWVFISNVHGADEYLVSNIKKFDLDEDKSILAKKICRIVDGNPVGDVLGRKFHIPPVVWSLPTSVRQTRAGTTGKDTILFITSNFNTGGAQRSLINLAKHLRGANHSIVIGVCNDPTVNYFYEEARAFGIDVFKLGAKYNPFFAAKLALSYATEEGIKKVVFWSLDPKLKACIAKFSARRFEIIDVSPGEIYLTEINNHRNFFNDLAYGIEEYFCDLNTVVHKYTRHWLGYRANNVVIPNGVELSKNIKELDTKKPLKFLVSGRISPVKSTEEILSAFSIHLESFPDSELYFYGVVEPRLMNWFEEVKSVASANVFWQGSQPCLSFLKEDYYDAVIVLGGGQGCPNTILEAFAHGVGAISNYSGGVEELVINRVTGICLAENFSIHDIVEAMGFVAEHRQRWYEYGLNGRKLVEQSFSIDRMGKAYADLFNSI